MERFLFFFIKKETHRLSECFSAHHLPKNNPSCVLCDDGHLGPALGPLNLTQSVHSSLWEHETPPSKPHPKLRFEAMGRDRLWQRKQTAPQTTQRLPSSASTLPLSAALAPASNGWIFGTPPPKGSERKATRSRKVSEPGSLLLFKRQTARYINCLRNA